MRVKILKLFIFFFSLSLIGTVFAEVTSNKTAPQDHLPLIDELASDQPALIPSYSMSAYDEQINYIYTHILNHSNSNLATRLTEITRYFLGRPYLLGALGEGPQGEFDQNPLYRTDAFDCMTFVETSLALAEANNLSQFKNVVTKIRYDNGHVNYAYRNHFTSVDWNPNNTRLGLIKNITSQLSLPIKYTSSIIDKPNWYRQATMARLKQLSPPTPSQAQQLLDALHNLGKQQKVVIGKIDYLPLAELFEQQQNQLLPKQTAFDQIPSGAIIEIVRPDWNLKNKIGTNINVQHMGFAIRTAQGLMFREATSVLGKTVDVPLVNYLRWVYVHNSKAGIHIEVPLQMRM